MTRRIYTCGFSELVLDLCGARIHSFRRFDLGEFFFASAKSAARAGVPLCAPWFGTGQAGSTHPYKHGFVKDARWEVVAEQVTDTEISLELALSAAQLRDLPGFAQAGFAPYAGLDYRLFIKAGQDLQLTLQFRAVEAVSVDAAFHTYFAAPLPAQVEIAPALQRDYVSGVVGQFSGNFLVAGHRDSVFLGGASTPIKLVSEVGAQGARVFQITSTAPDVIVWNPGPSDTQLLPGEWKEFVCVETGAVQEHALQLQAGQRKEIGLHIALVASGKS